MDSEQRAALENAVAVLDSLRYRKIAADVAAVIKDQENETSRS